MYGIAKGIAFFGILIMVTSAVLYTIGFLLLPFLGLITTKYWYLAIPLSALGLFALIKLLTAKKGQKLKPALAFLGVWVVGFAVTVGFTLLVQHQKVDEGRLVYALSIGSEPAWYDGSRDWQAPNEFLYDIMPDWDRKAMELVVFDTRCREGENQN